MKRFVLAVLAIVFVAVVYLPAQAGAQFLIPGAESALSVSFSPQYPAPDSNVTLTLQSSLYDLDSSSVTWTVNGKEATSGDAATPVNVKTGPLGSKTDVRADITGPNGSGPAPRHHHPALRRPLGGTRLVRPAFLQRSCAAVKRRDVRVGFP